MSNAFEPQKIDFRADYKKYLRDAFQLTLRSSAYIAVFYLVSAGLLTAVLQFLGITEYTQENIVMKLFPFIFLPIYFVMLFKILLKHDNNRGIIELQPVGSIITKIYIILGAIVLTVLAVIYVISFLTDFLFAATGTSLDESTRNIVLLSDSFISSFWMVTDLIIENDIVIFSLMSVCAVFPFGLKESWDHFMIAYTKNIVLYIVFLFGVVLTRGMWDVVSVENVYVTVLRSTIYTYLFVLYYVIFKDVFFGIHPKKSESKVKEFQWKGKTA